MSWGKDETFKITLLYDQTVLFSGLELYGILLAGISICGLMIILVPAMGKKKLFQSIFPIISIIPVMTKSDRMAKMGGSAKWFWSSFVRILNKKVRNVLGNLNSKWIQTLWTVVYYLAIVISAFLLTRDRQAESFINTEMEVSELQKNMVEAVIVFFFFCI